MTPERMRHEAINALTAGYGVHRRITHDLYPVMVTQLDVLLDWLSDEAVQIDAAADVKAWQGCTEQLVRVLRAEPADD